MLQINHNIKKYREISGKSQQQMAALLGIKRTTYANWETNTEPELTKIMELAKIFGVHYTTLIEGENAQCANTETSRQPPGNTVDQLHDKEDNSIWKEAFKDLKELSLSNNTVFTQAFANISEVLREVRDIKMNLNDAADKQQTFRIMTGAGQQVELETLAELRGLNKNELVNKARSIGDALLHDSV